MSASAVSLAGTGGGGFPRAMKARSGVKTTTPSTAAANRAEGLTGLASGSGPAGRWWPAGPQRGRGARSGRRPPGLGTPRRVGGRRVGPGPRRRRRPHPGGVVPRGGGEPRLVGGGPDEAGGHMVGAGHRPVAGGAVLEAMRPGPDGGLGAHGQD